jgi:ribonuclease D
MISIDFETTSLSPANGRVRLIQMSNGEETHVADAKDADPEENCSKNARF